LRPRPLAAVYTGAVSAPPRICCRRCSAVLSVASSLSLGSPLSPQSLRDWVVNPAPGYFPPSKCHMARRHPSPTENTANLKRHVARLDTGSYHRGEDVCDNLVLLACRLRNTPLGQRYEAPGIGGHRPAGTVHDITVATTPPEDAPGAFLFLAGTDRCTGSDICLPPISWADASLR